MNDYISIILSLLILDLFKVKDLYIITYIKVHLSRYEPTTRSYSYSNSLHAKRASKIQRKLTFDLQNCILN